MRGSDFLAGSIPCAFARELADVQWSATTWGRLSPSQRIVWCRVADLDVDRALLPFSKLDSIERASLCCALDELAQFSLDVAVPQ